MKRISLFSALLILLMFLASCNAVSRTDPEKGNTDAISLEEGGFDIGEKDVSTNMNKRIIDFTINDIILLEELKTAEGTIAAEYVFPETEHLDAPETRTCQQHREHDLSTILATQTLDAIIINR